MKTGEKKRNICGAALIIGKYGREHSWNGWASDPLPSTCARSGVARFIFLHSAVVAFLRGLAKCV